MKQKFFSLGGQFNIKDEAGVDVFVVTGAVFTFGHQLTFSDMEGNQLAFIKQKVFSWGPTYEIYRQGQLYAVVKKELFTFFKHVFTVDIPGPDDLVAEGDFLDLEFNFTRHGELVAQCSRQWFTFADTYGVDVQPGEDDVLILASTVVIDMVRSDRKNRTLNA